MIFPPRDTGIHGPGESRLQSLIQPNGALGSPALLSLPELDSADVRLVRVLRDIAAQQDRGGMDTPIQPTVCFAAPGDAYTRAIFSRQRR